MPSIRSLLPELCCRGVKPNATATWRPFLNCRASPIMATSAEAISGPIPLSCCTRPTASFSRPIARISLSSSRLLSLRQLWTIYKRTSLAQGFANSKHDVALSHVAFYSGARGVLRVLDYMIEHGDTEGAVRTIQRFGRQIKSDPRAAHTSAESA